MGRVKVYWSWIEAAVGIFRNPLKPERLMKRPHIRFSCGRWECKHKGIVYHMGEPFNTPKDAYNAYLQATQYE